MNKANTKELNEAIGKIEEAIASIQAVLDDEQGAYDDKSERWQESEAGELAAERLDTLQTQIDALEEVTGELTGIVNG